MITITLPDGSKKEFEQNVTGLDIAASIGSGLAKAALGIKVNGQVIDLSRQIDQDSEIAIITAKNEEVRDPDV